MSAIENHETHPIEYSETLRPPLWLLSFIFFLIASLAVSIWAAFTNAAGLATLAAGVLLVLFAREKMALTISITPQELRVGNAHIERHYLGEAIALTSAEMALTRGRDADPAAFLALRFWQAKGVKILLNDKRDPAPYWLVSSKTPTKLVAALSKNAHSS